MRARDLPHEVDLLVVGGGINGAGIARDAAGRGLSVLLLEQGDLGHATSASSTKLIHGGLRYLEQYEFRLVAEALTEREVLLRAAPHIIWPMIFVLPHGPGARPAWMIRAGLFLYDRLGRRRALPGSRGVKLAGTPLGGPLRPDVQHGFTYSDCWVEDSRLVVLNAVDAARRGATIAPGTRLMRAQAAEGRWHATCECADGTIGRIAARTLVNATGPWVDRLLREALGRTEGGRPVRLVKGSHLVTRRLYDGEHAYILQNDDGRIVFVIPYEGRFSLIGTTDVDYTGDPDAAKISSAETSYLLRAVARWFRAPPVEADIVHTYSGVRPLYGEAGQAASKVTRDYTLDYEEGLEGGALLSVYGGKITTYRRLAEQAVDRVAKRLKAVRGPWTARAPLPGGDVPNGDWESFALSQGAAHDPTRRRLLRAYGTLAPALMGGPELVTGVPEAELRHLWQVEFARTGEDALWRRSKLGLHLSPAEREAVTAWFAARAERPAARVGRRVGA